MQWLYQDISTTLCLKKCTNFEIVSVKIIRIDFDDIWQKYSKYSRIEFMFQLSCRFAFHQLFILQTVNRKGYNYYYEVLL